MFKYALVTLFALPAFLFVAPDAEARHPAYRNAPRVRVTLGLPGVNVRVGPWSVNYRPTPRVGYRWVDGYREAGAYSPGHWVPIGGPPQPGYVWVNGYWQGEVYVDGFWRQPRKRGHAWVDGYYDRGVWIEGGWAPAQRAAPTYSAPPPTYEAPPPTYEAPPAYDDYGYADPPDDAPLALPPDYDAPAYEAPSTERQPRVYSDSGRVRGETAARAPDAVPEQAPEDSIWGDPIDEEPLGEDAGDDENIHHSLDW